MITAHPVRSFLAPIAGFALILLAMNGYQYFKLKQSYTRELINEVATTELEELRSVFHDIEETLLLVRDWFDDSKLSKTVDEDLNDKLIPVLNRLEYVSNIILANNRGEEYFISRSEKNYITRTTHPLKNGSIQHFSEWNPKFSKLREWEEKGKYDPRTRPWFIDDRAEESVRWTDVYHFSSDGRAGITASVSWTKAGNDSENHVILGMDVSLDMIRRVLDVHNEQRPGILFLTRTDNGTVIEDNEKYIADSKDTAYANVPLGGIITHWKKTGMVSGELSTAKIDGSKWVFAFQKVDRKNSTFWIGLAAKPEELEDWFDYSFLKPDLVETIIALCGSALILLLIHQSGLPANNSIKKESAAQKLSTCLNLGEGPTVEFKSTIRTNLKTGKTGKEIELAWMKAAVAFLNTDGGTVLLGVDDNGELLGLETDDFENMDKAMLHVKNLLNHHIGPEFSSFFEAIPLEYKNKTVLMLECRAAEEAVFLKIGKNEEFYIRSGPSSTKLSPSQIISYIKKTKK